VGANWGVVPLPRCPSPTLGDCHVVRAPHCTPVQPLWVLPPPPPPSGLSPGRCPRSPLPDRKPSRPHPPHQTRGGQRGAEHAGGGAKPGPQSRPGGGRTLGRPHLARFLLVRHTTCQSTPRLPGRTPHRSVLPTTTRTTLRTPRPFLRPSSRAPPPDLGGCSPAGLARSLRSKTRA